MQHLSHHEIVVLLLSLGILLAAARIISEIARSFNQPAVLGEILTGIILGPTVLGRISPELLHYLFPSTGPVAVAFNTLTSLAVVLFLLVAGMELDFSTILKLGRSAALVSFSGLFFPFAVGCIFAGFFPKLLGIHAEANHVIFMLFFATALSISALPVIAKTLMDLNLYHSHMAVLIMAAAIFDDLAGWLIFAVILGLLGQGHGATLHVWQTVLLTLCFAAFMFTLGKWLIHRILPWLHAHVSWPGGILAFALSLAFLAAAFTEWIGIHAIFGAFLVGVALGDSRHLRKQTRITLDQFISFIFAPIFFASIGLRIDFITHFNLLLCIIVLLIACLGKVLGCYIGARLSKVPNRECWAVAFGLNARGAMEIILGILALQYSLITEEMFVALVVMALGTSLMSGPMIQRVLQRKVRKDFLSFLNGKHFFFLPVGHTREEAIRDLALRLSKDLGLELNDVESAVLVREQLSSTGMGNGLAIPHARLEKLSRPVLALGVSQSGVDFDAPDGHPAHLVFMLLTQTDDDVTQLQIISDIAHVFRDGILAFKAREAESFTEFLGLVKSGGQAHFAQA